MKNHTFIMWLGSLSAVVIAIVIGLLFPTNFASVNSSITLTVMAMLLSLFAIPFFLTGLRRFRVELRRAYLILCVGIGAFGLAQIQLPLINIFSIDVWVDSGGIAIPYLVGVVGFFWSMRILSQLLGIKSKWRSVTLAILVSVLLSLGAVFLPHVVVNVDEISYHIALGLSILNSVFMTFAAILAYSVRKKIGLSYAKAMDWLFRALAVLSFAGWQYAVVELTMNTGDWYYDYSIPTVPFIIGSLFLVIAGRTFGAIETTIVPSQVSGRTSQPNNRVTVILTPQQELDIVLYVANLVSNPTDIDLVLDRVRDITSRLQPGQPLSGSDREQLKRVYKELEDYLLHQDPLRVFTQQELRERISSRFGFTGPIRTTLWDKATLQSL